MTSASRIRPGSTPTAAQKPRAEGQPKRSQIDPGAKPSKEIKRWVFSFRFWNQIEFFGLSESTPAWFVSVLTKLQELSTKSVDEFLKNGNDRDAWRYHEIEWGQKNIPVQRKDLSWIEPLYLDNPDDYPLYQFQITTSLGRVIGFWDDNSHFNIVLFDPLHNMQPAKSFGYKVNPCSPLACDYTLLLDQVHHITGKCEQGGCQHAGYLKEIKHRKRELEAFNVLMMRFPDESDISAADELIAKGMAKSHMEIFEYGINYLSDRAK